MSQQTAHESDFVVIGSGFGGSVAALRLAEKGYLVTVIEKGKRYRTEDFQRTNWNLRKYLWMAANLGVNPLLTIAVLAEHIYSQAPATAQEVRS